MKTPFDCVREMDGLKGDATEFFIVANSNAAPFFSDTSHHYITSRSSEDAVEVFRTFYKHPAGLFAFNVYPNADAYHKNAAPLASWRSEKAAEQEIGPG